MKYPRDKKNTFSTSDDTKLVGHCSFNLEMHTLITVGKTRLGFYHTYSQFDLEALVPKLQSLNTDLYLGKVGTLQC